jgi:hypothetical protein
MVEVDSCSRDLLPVKHDFLFLGYIGQSWGTRVVTFHIIIHTSGLVIDLRPQTPKHIRGGWSHYM